MTEGAGPETFTTPWSVRVGPTNGGTRVTVEGELDASTAGDLARHVLATEHGAVELDLAGVTFVDSSGLAALIEAHLRLSRDGRRLLIVSESPTVKRVLELAGVTGHLDFSPG